MQPTRLIWPIVERTRFFDKQVQSAISLGISQVVICGAGYDDRALRFRTKGVRFFKLDHLVTQTDKLRRLKSMDADMEWLTLVPIGFRSDDVEAKLCAVGHDMGCPTLFICEGLLVYLNQQVGCKLLTGLRSRAAVNSILAASLAIHREGVDSGKVAVAVKTWRRAGETEPWLTILSIDSYLALFKQTGWKVDQNIDSLKLDTSEIHGRKPLITAKPFFNPP
jgi:methyltransferase (TIGR00027 family)